MSNAQKTLGDLPVGSRLIYRARANWRFATVSRHTEEKAVLIVCSPTGRTYRLSRTLDSELLIDGHLPVLMIEEEENWRENFAIYDHRW